MIYNALRDMIDRGDYTYDDIVNGISMYLEINRLTEDQCNELLSLIKT